MDADKKLRMDVYQEGQRAFNAGTPCPYTDWRAGTWEKGRAAAQAYHTSAFRDTVSLLRDATDCPLMQCKAALDACGGDFNAAKEYLRAPPTIEQRLARLERIVRALAPGVDL